jgi:hypothetical protein
MVVSSLYSDQVSHSFNERVGFFFLDYLLLPKTLADQVLPPLHPPKGLRFP